MKNNSYHNLIIQYPPDSYKIWFDADAQYLLQNISKGSFVLDVACGDGRSISDVVGITKNIIGIDHDDQAVESAKNNFKHIDSVKIIKADAESLPFSDEYFDYTICMGSFMNFGENKFKILSEMRRVLKNQGSMIISTFSENALSERLKLYKHLNAPINKIEGTVVYFDQSLGDSVSEQFSNQEMIQIFNKAGLKVVDHLEVGVGCIWRLLKI